jgi:hypothetical protein
MKILKLTSNTKSINVAVPDSVEVVLRIMKLAPVRDKNLQIQEGMFQLFTMLQCVTKIKTN